MNDLRLFYTRRLFSTLANNNMKKLLLVPLLLLAAVLCSRGEVCALVVVKCVGSGSEPGHKVDKVIYITHKRYVESARKGISSWGLGRKYLSYISQSEDMMRSRSGGFRVANSKVTIKGVTYDLRDKKDIEKLKVILDPFK
ncbi:hypothetical protein NT6N_23890 [Oceaniferula spumae]|uniref:Uncharacterized protein n=1 Tax=Oceaniferula spumae TaxID=2979115 RepID=A0AAT9FN13_9BACT